VRYQAVKNIFGGFSRIPCILWRPFVRYFAGIPSGVLRESFGSSGRNQQGFPKNSRRTREELANKTGMNTGLIPKDHPAASKNLK
jgi:hypothetical protein